MNTNSLLIELFTEELPPKALQNLSESFASNIYNELKNINLAGENSQYQIFASPRRLTVRVNNVLKQAASKRQSVRLMPSSVGINQGNRSPALIKKLKSLGLDENVGLEKFNDGKQEYLTVEYLAQGFALEQEINRILQETINKLPIPKLMSYQLKNGETVNFVRPAHNLLCIYGSEIIHASVLGLTSNNFTFGHRFLADEKSITVNHALDYEKLLEQNFVIADYSKRLEIIQNQLAEEARKLNAQAIAPQSLLNEVNSLVEYPQVYVGTFEEKFLNVPDECLILTMQSHQKYFALKKDNKLINKFLFVSNMKIDNPHNIIEGNEKVIRPRLSDAEFFFNEDKKCSLSSKIDELDKVIYHNKLGSQKLRIQRLAEIINIICNLQPDFKIDKEPALRACLLCKADLLSRMVGEFPELQGIMGRYYALNDGEDLQVADAVAEHYKPKFAGDSLPANNVSILLSLADKLETVTGMWGIGLKPTGEKDPYALRRHALGILRILIENNYNLNLKEVLEQISKLFNNFPDYTPNVNEIYDFCMDRLSNYFKEKYKYNVIDAVISQVNGNLLNVTKKLNAVHNFILNQNLQENIAGLISSNKRIDNILKKQEKVKINCSDNLLQEEAEKNLYAEFYNLKPIADKEYAHNNYISALNKCAELSQPLANFFTDVMVNAEDIEIKNNRLALLQEIHQLFNVIADLSKL